MELIPDKEPKAITFQQYQDFTPEKLERSENNIFFSEEERIRMILLLMSNIGINTMVKNLPKESRKKLREVLEENEMERKCLEIVEQEVLKFGRLKIEHKYKFDKQNNKLYIFLRVIDTNSIWSIKYSFNKENGEFKEEDRFHAFACADTLRELLE